MNIKLYRQKKKIPPVPTGKKIYQGEDSRPYADSDVLIVADGLGGRGGFPHTKIDARILDREEIYGIMFAPIFPADVSDEFKGFVTDNFTEIFETKEYYFDSDETTRRSGYFASRIVTAIALYEVKYNPEFAKARVFDGFANMTEEQKDARALELGGRLAEIILEKLTTVAELVGFEMEVSNKGAYLLPTTLTVALMNEGADAVDVLYLWAGDSRGYVWNVEDGMAQVTEDHERDETMTNLITLSRPFTVEGRFLTFKKPCAIFNASDGVYKPPVFVCPIDQEYLFLLAIDSFDNEAAAMDFLEKQYNMLSPDDSSTLALYGCGYGDFAQFKSAVKERIEVIKEQYVKKLDGIFDRDYLGELDAMLKNVPNSFAKDSVADKMLAVSEIEKIVINDMIDRRYAPYVESLNSTGNADEGIKRQKESRERLVKYVEDNWINGARFKGMVPGAIRDFIDGESVYDIDNTLRAQRKEILDAHYAKSARYNREVVNVINALVTDTLRNVELMLSDSAKDAIARTEDAFATFIDYCRSLRTAEDENVAAYLENKRERWSLNESYLEHDRAAIDGFVSLVLSVESLDNLPENYKCSIAKDKRRMELSTYHAQYVAASRELDKSTGNREDNKEKFAARYWRENKRLHGLIWNQYRSLVPDAVIDEIISATPGALEKKAELSAALEIREGLYADYNRRYFRSYRPTKI